MRYFLFVLAFLPLFFGTVYGEGLVITELEEFEGNTLQGGHFDLITLNSNTTVVTFKDSDNDGWIKTHNISDDGIVTELDSYEYNDRAYDTSLLKIDSDTILLATTGPNNSGHLFSFNISANGTIIEIDSLEHSSAATSNTLTKLDNGIVVLGYKHNSDSTITTFSVLSSGSISELQTLEFDTNVNSGDYSIVTHDSDTVVLAQYSDPYDGWIRTFDITSSSITEVESLLHSDYMATFTKLIKLDSDTFVLAQKNHDGSANEIKTFVIPANGTSITEKDSFAHVEYSNGFNSKNTLVKLDDNTVVLVNDGPLDEVRFSIFDIRSNDRINEDSTLVLTKQAYNESLVKLDSGIFALAYWGSNQHEFIKTFTVDKPLIDPTLNTLYINNGTTNLLMCIPVE